MSKSLYRQFFSIRNTEFLAVVLLCITAVGLPLSACLMSIGTIGLGVLWLVCGNWKYKIDNLKSNRNLLPIAGLFLISLIWLLNTSNYKYALHDISIKHVLLVLPLALGSINLRQKQTNIVLQVFVVATIISSLASLGIHLGIYVPKKPILNIRDITIIPHIRLGLMCVMSVCIIGYNYYKRHATTSSGIKLLLIFAALWLIYFTILLQTVTSWIVMIVLLCTYLIVYRKRMQKWLFTTSLFGTIGIIAATLLYIQNVYSDFYTVKPIDKDLKSKTSLGNAYTHDTTNVLLENGYYVQRFICINELRHTWDSISDIPFDGRDKRNNSIKSTIIRFLTSKGYTKDAEGLLSLTPQEIDAIERGCGCCVFLEKSNIYKRTYEIIWEFDRYKTENNPNGKSICMRFEFLKASKYLISNNFWTGVGTGDFRDEFREAYNHTDSKLSKEYRKLAICNQYITFTITFGIIGLLACMYCIIAPFAKSRKRGFLLISFFTLIVVSMISENTLDSQAGVLLFGFFYTLLLKEHN